MLHGWTMGDISKTPEFLPDNEANWMGWTKKELEKLGYTVTNPFIRFGYKSDYEEWRNEIEKLDIDENTILVGWSSGGAFFVRWLGETKRKVKKLILVAPSKVVENTEENMEALRKLQEKDLLEESKVPWKRFHDFKCDTTIKDRVEDITIFISNDADWLVDSAKLYAKEFEAKLIEIENQGHFSNAERLSPEFPEMLEAIIS